LYARWGWLVVFVTPAIVSGTAKMPPYRFALWNLLDAFGWTVSVAASAYGVVRLATGHHTWHDIAILVIGLAARGIRHRHRHAASPQAHGPASANFSSSECPTPGRCAVTCSPTAHHPRRPSVMFNSRRQRTMG